MKLRAFKAASVLALVLSFSLSAQAAKPVYAKKAAATGKSLRRMQPKEFAREWQPSLAWKFHDPGPPEYKGKLEYRAKGIRILSSCRL